MMYLQKFTIRVFPQLISNGDFYEQNFTESREDFEQNFYYGKIGDKK